MAARKRERRPTKEEWLDSALPYLRERLMAVPAENWEWEHMVMTVEYIRQTPHTHRAGGGGPKRHWQSTAPAESAAPNVIDFEAVRRRLGKDGA